MKDDAYVRFEPALNWLDVLLHREILRLRSRYQLSLNEFRGLYISDQQVDAYVTRRSGDEGSDSVDMLTARARFLRAHAEAVLATDGRWQTLLQLASLGRLEQCLLLLACAQALHTRYEAIYAYLNNDIARKYPTVDLAMRMFGDAGTTPVRAALALQSPLFASGLLEPVESSPGLPDLNRGFGVSPGAADYLLGLLPADRRLAPFVTFGEAVCNAADEWNGRCAGLSGLLEDGGGPLLTVLEGAARACRGVAAHIARASDRELLRINLLQLLHDPAELPDQLVRLRLLARLRNSVLYLEDASAILGGEKSGCLPTMLSLLAEFSVPVLMPMAANYPWRTRLADHQPFGVLLDPGNRQSRARVWQKCMADLGCASGLPLDELADRFDLDDDQIRAAVAQVAHQARVAGDGKQTHSLDALFAAARAQSLGEMAQLAEQIEAPFSWDQLVLPASTLGRVREIIAAVRNRYRVHDDWGFHQRLGGSRGLIALFTGGSGTGKTMTASVIAQRIGLDLFRINLAGVVSKYIGETEKNLDRVFNAAARANCVLFFDEAEALMGKRSEVKDAHDRYANIEIAYLLQKVEAHNGIVILATNIAKNIDAAFSRRMHYTIEFPRPDAQLRERLWRGMLQAPAPLAADIDFPFLARRFELTGGDIKTIVLDAAMQAAGGQDVIDMRSLVNALWRHLLKQNRVPGGADFKQYRSLIGDTDQGFPDSSISATPHPGRPAILGESPNLEKESI